jgi:hypothetical protein
MKEHEYYDIEMTARTTQSQLAFTLEKRVDGQIKLLKKVRKTLIDADGFDDQYATLIFEVENEISELKKIVRVNTPWRRK